MVNDIHNNRWTKLLFLIYEQSLKVIGKLCELFQG